MGDFMLCISQVDRSLRFELVENWSSSSSTSLRGFGHMAQIEKPKLST